MNVDFNTLSSAVHLVGTTKNTTQDVKLVGSSNNAVPPTAPSRRASRRRSSIGCGTAKQFVEAANQSWTFATEDLPIGDVALQRRRSKRTETTKQAKFGHRSFTIEEEENQKPSVIVDECSPLLKIGSSKMLPPRNKTQPELKRSSQQQQQQQQQQKQVSSSKALPPRNKTQSRPRRASMSGGFAVAAPAPTPQPTPDLGYGDCSPKAARKLSRRSSLIGVSVHSNLDNSNGTTTSDPTPTVSPPLVSPARTKRMARRNTIHASSNNDEEQGMTQGPRRSLSKNSPQGKGQVRFELDQKNRIKRRVSYISKQTSRTDAKYLWWSEADLGRIYQRENRVYDKFSNDKRYTRAIRKMWGNCSKAASVPLSPEAISHVTGAPSRGLEVDILETVRDRRMRVIANLLDAQETLREFDPTVRAKVLGARYKNLCKTATRFARKMGEGDALEAANIHSK